MPFCNFCLGAGINGPHDHFLRASKMPNAKITCPTLLNATCTYCNCSGHTASHCGEKLFNHITTVKDTSVSTKNDWVTKPHNRQNNPLAPAPATTNRLVSRFAGLEVDDLSSDEECIECLPSEIETPTSWSHIVQSNSAPEHNFNMGYVFYPMSRWADEE